MFASWKVKPCRLAAIISAWMSDSNAPLHPGHVTQSDIVSWLEPVELQSFIKHKIWHISLKPRESVIAAGRPIIFFCLTRCWLTWNCGEPEQNMKGAVLTVWRCCRPRLCFWCVNPVTLMPKHFSGSDAAQRVRAALNAADWLEMFD